TEYKYVLETFTALALAKPPIGFQLIKDGKTLYHLAGVKSYAERITQLYPQEKAGLLLPVNYSDSELLITGLIGHPSLAKNYTQPQYIFLNERPIKDNLLGKAVKDGYSTTLMKGMSPVFFIYLALKTDLFDINVHPRKSQVKFYQPQKIFYAVKHSVAKALEKSLQQEFHAKLTQDSSVYSAVTPIKTAKITNNVNEFQPEYFSGKSTGKGTIKKSLEFTRNLLEPLQEVTQTDFFQVFKTYLIIEKDKKLLIIDQHAADERVNFEKISQEFSGTQKISGTALLLPDILKLSQKEKLLMVENLKTLNKIGFVIEEYPGNDYALVEIPSILQGYNYSAALLEILHDLDEMTNSREALSKALNNMISTIACHASIRAGDQLSPMVVQRLISNLFKCQLPYSCPHGRPIIWEISRSELEKQFKRKL
ncbi:MAG TPA: hypothetical protein VJC17_03280, partial [Candidatus Dojkabacteria bacterium]|nr:hypothetical protein [Candidatus Dojkabacteria bacterium]